MVADASIYGQIQPYKTESPFNQLAQILQIQNAQQANQLNQLKAQEYQDATARQNELRALLGKGVSPYEAALRTGNIKDAGELAKAQAAANKDNIETATKKAQALGAGYKYVVDNPTLENANAVLDRFGMTGLMTPQEVAAHKAALTDDPVKIKNAATIGFYAALKPEDLKLAISNIGLGNKNVTQGVNPFTGAVTNLATNDIGSNPDEAAKLAEQKRHNQAVEANANRTFEQGKWQYDAERGGLVNMTTGEFKPAVQGGVPIGAKDKPLPEAAQKQVIGTRNLQDAVGNYLEKLKTFPVQGMASPDARAAMGNAYNNMMLQAKEAYNLGVLNGPDYDILQSVVKDPTKFTSILTSNAALEGQAKELRRIAGSIEKTVLEAHNKPYTPRATATAATVQNGVFSDAEKERRYQEWKARQGK